MKKLLLMVLCLCLLLGFTGCGAPAAGVSATCAELADSVEKAVAFTELTDVSQDYMEKYLWIEAADLEDWVMRRDVSRATPEMILIVKVKDGADKAAVKQLIQDYHDEQTLQYRDYQPGEMFKLEGAKVLENGTCLALIVSPDAAKAVSALGKGWK